MQADEDIQPDRDNALSEERAAPADNKSSGDLLTVSAEFSASLSLGGKPDLDAWLAKVAPDQQKALLQRLQSVANAFVESDAPRSSSAPPATKDRTIDNARSQELVDSASMSASAAETATRFAGTAERQQLGDYELLGELGRGGMGVVYKARHGLRGDLVALKILPRVDGESLHRFKREFRSLADIAHPNLIGLRSLENAGNQWFFTMDLVENAQTFLGFVRPNDALELSRLTSAMLQLCEGLRKLHELDILHRDIKPSNVVVDPNGRVRILDFGLVSELTRNDQTLSIQSVSGTPAYMSPEAVEGATETFASDWYSVGAMLYESLSGNLPFTGNAAKILAEKIIRDAPDLGTLDQVPRELSELCMTLVSRDATLRPGYEEILRILGVAPLKSESRANSAKDQLLGREWHLDALRNAFETVKQDGRPKATFISGKSGEGKSALIESFIAEIRNTPDAIILSGRCYDRESVPFKALDSLIDSLASHLRKLDPRTAAILLPDDTGFLARLFPVLMRVDVVAERPVPKFTDLDEQQIRRRAFGALKGLLFRMGQRTRIVLICDDLQWGDADSASVLASVFSGDDVPPLMFIGCYRVDEVDASPFLQTWNSNLQSGKFHVDLSVIEVGSLSEKDCRGLVARHLPQVANERLDRLTQELLAETGGNAFFLREVLDCLQVDGHNIQRVPLSQVLTQKLSKLPDEAPDLLNIVAVSGQALEVEELIEAAQSSSSAHSTLTAMRNQRLLRYVDEEHSRIDTYHDKLRETVLDSIESRGRTELHKQLGATIERQANLDPSVIQEILDGKDVEHSNVERIYDLSFHFNEAGEAEKGGLYAYLAAEQARRQFAPEIAAAQLELAEAMVRGGNLKSRLPHFVEALSESYYWLGRNEDAKQILKSIPELKTSPLHKAKILGVAGENAFAMNQPNLALEYCRQALAEVGESTPRNALTGWLGVIRYFAIHLWHFARPTTGSTIATDEQKLITQLLSNAARYSMFLSGSSLAWFMLRGVDQCRKFKSTGELSQVYGIYSLAAAEFGFFGHAQEYFVVAERAAKESNDLFAIGMYGVYRASCNFGVARYRNAVATMAEANRVLDAVGGTWFRHMGTLHASLSRMMMGDLRLAMLENWQNLNSCIRLNDIRANCTFYAQLRASDGQFPSERILEKLPRNDEDVLSTSNLDKAIGIRALHLGDFDQAIASFERALRRPYRAILPNWHVIAGIPFLVRALRLSADNLQASNPEEAKRRRKRALRLGKRSVWICRFFPNDYAFALREYSEVLIDAGKLAGAERVLRKSCQFAEKIEAPYELAKSQLALAELAIVRGEAGADQKLAHAEESIARFQQQILDALGEIEPQLASFEAE